MAEFEKPRRRIKGQDVLLVVAGSFGITVASYVGLGLLLWVVAAFQSQVAFDQLWDPGVAPLFARFIGYAGSLFLVYQVFVRRRSMSWRDIGLTEFNYAHLKIYLIFIVLFIGLRVNLISLVQSPDSNSATSFPDHLTVWTLTLTFLNVVFLAGFVEEILYRGFLYRWIRQYLNVMLSTCISSAFFSLAHLHLWEDGGAAGWISILFIFIFGAITAQLYERSGSLWPPIIFHSGNNLIVLIAQLARL